MADDFDAQKRIAEREAEIEQLKARLFDLEVQRDAAAGMWMHYKAIVDHGPVLPALTAYMKAETTPERDAAFLRTYAARVLDRTASSWEIPNTVATTLQDIADRIEKADTLRLRQAVLEEIDRLIVAGGGECICRTTRCQHGAHLHHNGVCEICNAGICWC